MPLRGSSFRGFPFDEEEGSGAWSELAARHPDIAARLRQRPATWARKRRPSSQDGTEDFGDTFGGFDRFPFDDIPPEFREHFPNHWNRRFGPRDEPQPQSQASPPSHPPPQPQPQPQPHQQTAATQTEYEPPTDQSEQTQIPQYGLRNTVDLGQKSPADPSLVDAEERSQRSVSAPPESRPGSQPAMSQEHQDQPSNVRHIPIFVEGRDEPVINKSAHFGEPKPQYAPPPQPQPQPHIDRDQYFADDGPHAFHHTPNFSRAFGTPFGKGYRQGPQPFVQQKVYPQAAFTRGASPQRSQSPRPQPHPEEHFVKVPVHHEQSTAKPEPAPTKAQQKQAPPPQPTPQPPPPQREATPPHPPQPSPNDPITMILSIQTDVLNLMTEVENFAGAKNDKSYLFLDEMLTRNLIKLDNIETEGKENIRQARKEAIKCIQKCIAVLEAKAESNANKGASTPQPQQKQEVNGADAPQAVENGEVEMKDAKEEVNVEPQAQVDSQQPTEPQPKEEKQEQTPHVDKPEATPEAKASEPQAADTRPDVNAEPPSEAIEAANKPEESVENKCPKKTTKKRDKSKDKKVKSDSNKDTGKEEMTGQPELKNEEVMQIDDKGDKAVQGMDVDGAASQ